MILQVLGNHFPVLIPENIALHITESHSFDQIKFLQDSIKYTSNLSNIGLLVLSLPFALYMTWLIFDLSIIPLLEYTVGSRTLHMKLQKMRSIFHTQYNFLSQLQRFFSIVLYMWGTIFTTTIFFGKIFAVLCAVCKGHRHIILYAFGKAVLDIWRHA